MTLTAIIKSYATKYDGECFGTSEASLFLNIFLKMSLRLVYFHFLIFICGECFSPAYYLIFEMGEFKSLYNVTHHL